MLARVRLGNTVPDEDAARACVRGQVILGHARPEPHASRNRNQASHRRPAGTDSRAVPPWRDPARPSSRAEHALRHTRFRLSASRAPVEGSPRDSGAVQDDSGWCAALGDHIQSSRPGTSSLAIQTEAREGSRSAIHAPLVFHPKRAWLARRLPLRKVPDNVPPPPPPSGPG